MASKVETVRHFVLLNGEHLYEVDFIEVTAYKCQECEWNNSWQCGDLCLSKGDKALCNRYIHVTDKEVIFKEVKDV